MSQPAVKCQPGGGPHVSQGARSVRQRRRLQALPQAMDQLLRVSRSGVGGMAASRTPRHAFGAGQLALGAWHVNDLRGHQARLKNGLRRVDAVASSLLEPHRSRRRALGCRALALTPSAMPALAVRGCGLPPPKRMAFLLPIPPPEASDVNMQPSPHALRRWSLPANTVHDVWT